MNKTLTLNLVRFDSDEARYVGGSFVISVPLKELPKDAVPRSLTVSIVF